jgi:hypothetical protein
LVLSFPQPSKYTRGSTKIHLVLLVVGGGCVEGGNENLLLPSVPDYVCVLDVDLLELVIKTWKGSTEGRLVSTAVTGG